MYFPEAMTRHSGVANRPGSNVVGRRHQLLSTLIPTRGWWGLTTQLLPNPSIRVDRAEWRGRPLALTQRSGHCTGGKREGCRAAPPLPPEKVDVCYRWIWVAIKPLGNPPPFLIIVINLDCFHTPSRPDDPRRAGPFGWRGGVRPLDGAPFLLQGRLRAPLQHARWR